jgi:hypothetical protein
MPKDKPIQAVGLKFKHREKYICAIQVIMSNGCNSQVFLGTGMNSDKLKDVKITPQVNKIRGTLVGCYVKNIIFQDKEGVEISRIFSKEEIFAPDLFLDYEEEIIGVYGTKD